MVGGSLLQCAALKACVCGTESLCLWQWKHVVVAVEACVFVSGCMFCLWQWKRGQASSHCGGFSLMSVTSQTMTF